MLLFIRNGEPVLNQNDAGAHQHFFKLRNGSKELLVLVIGAKAHHLFNPRPVVPAAIKQNNLATGWKVTDVALEIPLGALTLARGRKRCHTSYPWVEPLGDALNGATLTRRVATFEEHNKLQLILNHPVLQLHQLTLQPKELAKIKSAVDGSIGGRTLLRAIKQKCIEPVVIKLHFKLFVVAIKKV